jgi:hypothetical protein
MKRPLDLTKPILQPYARTCEKSFTCLEEEALGLDYSIKPSSYGISVEVHGGWCTKDCYCSRKLHNMAKEHVCILIVLY